MSRPNIINLIFDAGNGECNISSREATVGQEMGELPLARREGYVFEGWFTAPGNAGDKVTAADTLAAESDLVLYAHYKKLSGSAKKKSMFKLQKRVLIVLSCLIVLLTAGYFVVNYIVSFLPYTDPADGADYYKRQLDGVWAIYDTEGEMLPRNEDGYFLTAAGTQLKIDAATGNITPYAFVDTEGIEELGANMRILMFAQIRQSDVARISVNNQHGSFAFYVDDSGNVQIEGFETDKALIQYDKEKYAYLCVGAGYPLTTRKLDTAEVLKRGYAEYGLVPETRVDEDGNEYEYKPTRYTVTSKGGVSHTVLIGDKLISEGGYYVKLDGEDNPAVYVMGNSTYESALLCRVEDLITPMIGYPTTLMNCYNVENFIITSAAENEGEDATVELAFDFISLEARENSLYTSDPYFPLEGGAYKYSGYRLNGNEISALLQALYEPTFNRVCKLGATKEALTEYGLDRPDHMIYYELHVDAESEDKVPNTLLIRKNEDGNYFVYSDLCNLIVEINADTLRFLDYEPIDWVNANIVWINLAFLRSIDIQSPAYSAKLEMDNSASDQSKAISSANVTFTINGETPDYIVYKESYASGTISTETPVYNLRQFYKTLLSLTIAGSVYQGQYTLTDEQMEAYKALPDSECQLVLHLEGEDMAATYNKENYTENNSASLTLRFYRYSEGRSYMTINGEGEFYVSASFVEKIISDAQKLEAGTLIDASAKN